MLQRVPQPFKPLQLGTDGFRDRAEYFDMQGLERMGHKIAQSLPPNSTYILGRDGRASGLEFQDALSRGIRTANRGIRIEYAGIIPTPLLSYMSANARIQGVMITASHNPAYDNGLKFFSNTGNKISREEEARLKDAYNNQDTILPYSSRENRISIPRISDSLKEQYISQLKDILQESQFEGKVAIDCANGATSEIGREIFSSTRRGLEFKLLANTPDGHNINEGCGVTNPQFLEQILTQGSYDLGISFDGDGDRMGLVDERGRRIDGDFVLAYLATKLKEQGKLTNNGVVVTQYSNLALDSYLQNLGIEVQRVENGDKAVMEKLRANNWSFGGEHSGHIILDTTIGSGDGIRAATEILRNLDPLRPVSEQFKLYTPNPQIQQSFKLDGRIGSIKELPQKVQDVIEQQKDIVEQKGGRILIRPSGTEPKLRVLVESGNNRLNKSVIHEISQHL
ncbi:MAG: hypothetical protein ACMXYB_04160 [Candidatus Woesearchaeota archaeon]